MIQLWALDCGLFMKRMAYILLCIFGILCVVYAGQSAKPRQHKPVATTLHKTKSLAPPLTAEYRLRNQAQKYEHDPLATYAVIMQAAHQHLGPQAANIYSDFLALHPDDPEIQSAYAFSQFMAVGPLSESYFNGAPTPLVKKLRQDQLKADYYRSLAQKRLPNSNVIQFEAALPDFYYAQANPLGAPAAQQKAVNALRQVTKDAPLWADAHYWLASVLDLDAAAIYSVIGPEKSKDQTLLLGQEMLLEAQKAEQIQPKLHMDCLKLYLYAYQWLSRA